MDHQVKDPRLGDFGIVDLDFVGLRIHQFGNRGNADQDQHEVRVNRYFFKKVQMPGSQCFARGAMSASILDGNRG